jgi:Zn-dependent membrane protease YugP
MAIFGLFLGMPQLVNIGIVLFTLAVVFLLITLPVEFNASRRAVLVLESSGTFTKEELGPVKKVLSAAAMTYVASALVAIANLLRLVLLSNSRRDD